MDYTTEVLREYYFELVPNFVLEQSQTISTLIFDCAEALRSSRAAQKFSSDPKPLFARDDLLTRANTLLNTATLGRLHELYELESFVATMHCLVNRYSLYTTNSLWQRLRTYLRY